MGSVPPLAAKAIEQARAGNIDQALALAKQALSQHADDSGLHLFVGLLHTRRSELAAALPHLRRAHELAPGDPAARVELARVLIGLGEHGNADRLLDHTALRLREGRKLRATLLFVQGNLDDAATLFRQLIDEDPNDFEAWANLGGTMLAMGAAAQAASAFGRSLQLRPQQPKVWDKWAEASVAAASGDNALRQLTTLTQASPADVDLQVTRARLLDLLGRPGEAVQTLEDALASGHQHAGALAALAELQERQNNLPQVCQLVEQLEAADSTHERLPLLKAELALRKRQFSEAVELAEAAPPSILPGTRARILGQAYDRLGDHARAWDAYRTMNLEDGRTFPRAAADGRRYLNKLQDDLQQITPEWYNQWPRTVPLDDLPAFLTGFPRSGTTLLDTFLMGHPKVAVSEEHPLLERVAEQAGPPVALPRKSDQQVEALRSAYYQAAHRFVPDIGDRLLVDKFPFALVAMPYVQLLFADAPILFVKRHPCDVVLSCYFTRFQPEGPAACFLDVVDAAKLYDGMMRYFERCRVLLPLRIHEVAYERMVADPEGELRQVATFLGLDWSNELTANRETAQKRGFIRTPSYAQVAEPVYASSVARWTRYRAQMADALPILEPWARKLGYDL